jgi:hypothetical protein
VSIGALVWLAMIAINKSQTRNSRMSGLILFSTESRQRVANPKLILQNRILSQTPDAFGSTKLAGAMQSDAFRTLILNSSAKIMVLDDVVLAPRWPFNGAQSRVSAPKKEFQGDLKNKNTCCELAAALPSGSKREAAGAHFWNKDFVIGIHKPCGKRHWRMYILPDVFWSLAWYTATSQTKMPCFASCLQGTQFTAFLDGGREPCPTNFVLCFSRRRPGALTNQVLCLGTKRESGQTCCALGVACQNVACGGFEQHEQLHRGLRPPLENAHQFNATGHLLVFQFQLFCP